MSPAEDNPGGNRPQRTLGFTLAVVSGEVGYLTSLVLIAALFGGMWLDNQFNTQPLFTVGLLVISVPITLVAMVWIVKKTTSRMQSTDLNITKQHSKEDNISG